MSNIKFIYFDAANTLIHKPDVWPKLIEVFATHSYEVNSIELKKIHKITSEQIKFPDNTNKQFYKLFNTELLKALSIVPTEAILDDVFNACTYLPWKKFDDVNYLRDINIPMGIISNFNTSLKQKVIELMDIPFKHFIVSEDVSFAKPDKRIYEYALNKLNVLPNEVLFIGDSVKLDIEPALSIGFNSYLIDRDNVYPDFKPRITSFSEIKNLVCNQLI